MAQSSMTDDRVTCQTCRHLKGSCCTAAKAALLSKTRQREELSPEFIKLNQRCYGYAARR
jgi:hypothetical protein